MLSILLSGVSFAWEHRSEIAEAFKIAKEVAPQVIAIGKEGYTAYEAIQKSAPELIPHIRGLAGSLFAYLPAGSGITLEQVESELAHGIFTRSEFTPMDPRFAATSISA